MNGKNRSWLVPLAAAMVMACGGGSVPSASDQAGNETPPPPSTEAKKGSPTVTPTPTPIPPDPTPAPKRPVAGNIDVISTEAGQIEDVPANNGDDIRERQTVRTNEAGSLTFNLLDKIEFCNMYPNAKVKVKPSSDVYLHFQEGEFACEARPDAGPVKVLAGPDVVLDMSDPQFIVSIGPKSTTIRALRGFIDVRSLSGDSNVLLGPMESTDTSGGTGTLAPVRIWAPSEIENPQLRDDISTFKPRVDVSMPDVGSVVLNRMDESGSINVGVPDGLTGESLDFVNGFLDGQSKDWNLGGGAVQQVVGDQDVAAALEAGTIDMFVSPADLPGLGKLPLFVDPGGQQFWLYYNAADTSFGAAQEEYLKNVVIDESYRQVYLRELGTEPVYEGVDELFELSPN
jgi:hypothetical protein